MRRRMIVLLVALAASPLGAGSASAVGQAGGISLQFPIGARYNALGEAGTALATDATAMWWNPGGLAFVSRTGSRWFGHAMYSPLAAGLADDVNLFFVGGGKNIRGWGSLGFYLTYLSQGEQVATSEADEVLGTFNSYQFAIGATYGVRILPQLGVGIGAKYFRDELAPDEFTQDQASGSGQSFAIDVGAHFRPIPQLWTGVSLTNLGPDITFIDADQSDPMPLTLRFGVAAKPYRTKFTSITAVADYLVSLVSQDETTVIGVGLEWGYLESLFLRVGYKDDSEGDIQSFTAGGGVNLKRWTGQPLTFDYASVPQADGLDRVHRFSFGVAF